MNSCKAHNTQNNDKGVKINPFTQIYPMHYAVIQLINFYTLLNQARAWFPKIDPVRTSACVCVSAPKAINN